MDLLEHLLYQELLGRGCSLSDAVRTIEKALVERKLVDADELCHEAGRTATPPDDASAVDRVYGALLIKRLFEAMDVDQIRDIINLVHKESLARNVWLALRDEPIDLHEVERLLHEFARLPLGESQVSPNIAIGIRVQLISLLISDNLFYIGVAKNHITMRDVAALMDRFIGKYGQRSRVGGKSAGVILANRIVRPVFGEATGLEDRIGEVESYFLTAQVFNRFIEHNRLEEGHSLKYMEPDERDAARPDLERRFDRGEFPEDVVEAVGAMIDRLGDGPLIVRSSSLLEDSMGFPFYGKYESVFITNQGSHGERTDALIAAVKRVYVSILSSSVLEYRKDKALLDYDDMMCVLIQRVVGSRHGPYFFPDASGVAFSRNQYRWSRRIDPAAGVARLVYGLGTRAVDRSGDDYPRLVALSDPALRPEGTQRERIRYSQRSVDVLDLRTRTVESVHFVDLVNEIRASGEPYEPVEALSLVRDGQLERPLYFPDSIGYADAVVTFDGLIDDEGFPSLLREVLRRLANAYGVPVDVEFAWHDGRLFILQCRPLAQGSDEIAAVALPRIAESQRLLFDIRRDIFRSAARDRIRYLVYVDGERYHAVGEPSSKLEVARLIGRVNRALEGERYMLIGPGRWGTSNLGLGVRVTYGDINHATVLAEVGSTRTGYTPEVSYGTHFFQDLIEADIVPLALFPDEADELFDESFLLDAPNSLADIVPGADAGCVTVVDLDSYGPGRLSIWLSADEGRGIGLLG